MYMCIYIYIYIYIYIIHTHNRTLISPKKKKNEIVPRAVTWLGLEGIMLHEITQAEKNKYYTLSVICGI